MKNFIFFSICLFTFGVFAETTSTSVSSSKTSTAVEDIDKVVTDAELRTKSGSKSKWSSSLSISYFGGPLSKPFGDEAPNIEDDPNPPQVNATGNIGFRYRLKPGESLIMGTGFSKTRPFSGNEKEELEVSTPNIHWNNTFKIEDVQMSSVWGAYVMTTDYHRNIGQVGMLMYALSALTNPGQSRFFTGISLDFFGAFFDKNRGQVFRQPVKSVQSDYGVGLSPRVQYKFTDAVKAYTSLELFRYRHIRSESAGKMERTPISQNIGAAIAIRRDIFFSPHISFLPDEISSKKTAVNFSTYINMF